MSKYITRAWIKEHSHRITKRDKEIIKLISDHKILTRDQLIILHPSFKDVKYPENVINRRLSVLYDLKLIDRVQPLAPYGSGSKQYHYTLDRGGALLLDIDNHRNIIIDEPDSYPPRRLPIYYRHTIGINEFKCRLLEELRLQGGSIISWRLEEENKRTFKFKKTYTLKPDVLCLIKRPNGKGFIFFYEHDQGTEYKKVIKEKIEAYKVWRLSNSWLSEDWASMMRSKTFPPVIFLTAGDNNRIKWMEDYASKSGINIIIGHINNTKDIIRDQIIKGS